MILACTFRQDEFDDMAPDTDASIAGRISDVRKTVHKRGALKGAEMAFVKIKFGLDVFDTTFFADAYAKHKHLIEVGRGILIRGKKDDRGNLIVFGAQDAGEFCREQRSKEVTM